MDTELHVPVDAPVRLILTSNDVIHSLFIPAFRVKRDAVPGRYNYLWFQATTPGEYLALCSEYCGTRPLRHAGAVVVHEPGLYEALARGGLRSCSARTACRGRGDAGRRRCGGCHTVDGTASVGPTFKGVYGHRSDRWRTAKRSSRTRTTSASRSSSRGPRSCVALSRSCRRSRGSSRTRKSRPSSSISRN